MLVLQIIALSSLLLLTLSGAVKIIIDLIGSPKTIKKLQLCREGQFGYIKDITIPLNEDSKQIEYEVEHVKEFIGIKCYLTENPKENPMVIFKDMKENMSEAGNDNFIMTPFKTKANL